MTAFQNSANRGLIALALGLTLALAGCESGGEKTAVKDPPETNAANTKGPIDLSGCGEPAGGALHLQIGQSDLKIPLAVLADVTPAKVRRPETEAETKLPPIALAEPGAGCPEKPLDAVFAVIRDDLGDPMLEGALGLRASPKDALAALSQVTSGLQADPPATCNQASQDLMACVGTETRGDRTTEVLYLITTDRSENLNSGGPLSARCVREGEKVIGCGMADTVQGDVAFDATLNPGTFTTAALRAAHGSITSYIDKLRR